MDKNSMKQRVVALISAGALAASMAAMPALAFAANDPSAGAQTGNGTTNLTMQYIDTDEHHTSGDNLSFTVPSALNYVVDASGALTGPQATLGASPTAAIDNQSDFQIHVSSVDVDAVSGWNIVTDEAFAAASGANTVQLNIGPTGNQIDAADYLTNWEQGTHDNTFQGSWNMAADGAASNADQVALDSSGQAKNITQNLTSAQQFGTINWYVKAGPSA